MLCAMGLMLFRQGSGHIGHPLIQLVQRHLADLRQRQPPHLRGAGLFRQTGAAAFRAGLLFQETLHPLHAAFVLHLGQSVFHRVDGAVIGEIQLRRVVGIFGFIEDVLFHRRAVIDDLLFLRCQLPKGHVCAHAHGPAHVGHQRPHQAFSTGRPPLRRWSGMSSGTSDAISTVRTVPVPSQVRTGALRVEGQFFRGRGVKRRAALRAATARARRPPPGWAADNGRWGSGGWPGGRTSAEGCSTAPFPCRRCCGCRARRAAGAAPARRGHTAPRPPAPVAACVMRRRV